MSSTATSPDPAFDRQFLGANDVYLFFRFGILIITFAIFSMLGLFWAVTVFGPSVMSLGIGLGALGGFGAGFIFFWTHLIREASSFHNFSMWIFETPELPWSLYAVLRFPPLQIQRQDGTPLILPTSIPVGTIKGGKASPTALNGGGTVSAALAVPKFEMKTELHLRSPKCEKSGCTCTRHLKDFSLTDIDEAQLLLNMPFLPFASYAYLFITQIPYKGDYFKCVIIFPCPLDKLRSFSDFIFYRGFPVRVPTTLIAVARTFEMDENMDVYHAPAYVCLFSTWHVELAQQLSGFTSAYMVPSLERVVEVYNLWGIADAIKLRQELSTVRARLQAYEGGKLDFDQSVLTHSHHYVKTRDLMGKWPTRVRMKWLTPRTILLIVGLIALTASIVYILTLIT